MSAKNMEIVSGQVNTVDTALQIMTVDIGVNNNRLELFNEGKGLAYQTLEGLNVADPIPGKHVFTLSV